ITHTDRDIWDCLALDLETPRPGRRPNLSVIDFRPISQAWLRRAVKEWVKTLRPDTSQVKRTLQAATLASAALEARPGGGHDERELRFADLDAIFEAINTATNASGGLYETRYRRGLWANFHAVIDLGRATDVLVDLPGTFSRHSSHSIAHEEANEDHIGKAVPETVVAQLDAHMGLLGVDGNYGRIWSAVDTNAMFAAAYQVLRDTGRRPGEVVSLRLDCLECDAGEWALIYDNHKKRRLRRRLPITAETAAVIQAWQARRAGMDLPACTQGWLFPACWQSSGPGHLGTIRLSQALRSWVDAIPRLDSDVPGLDGTPLPFDRLAIYPYAFRHSYA
ncbi:MAG: tyrosine-type recombinase/integrase, partial [Candidatus Dormibacteria bacterium]